MVRKYFGTDGIRGRANGVITPELALKVGQAAGLVFQRGDHRHRVVIGKDTRLSGYMIETALIVGLHLGRHGRIPARPDADAGGCHVDALACVPISGVMISASHNPFARQRHQVLRARMATSCRTPRSKCEMEKLIETPSAPHCWFAGGKDIGRAKRVESAQERLRRIRQAHAAAQHDASTAFAYRGRLRQWCWLPKSHPTTLWELGAEVISRSVSRRTA